MEKALFACDELTGLINRSRVDSPRQEPAASRCASIKKRIKEKAFARNVRRDDVLRGAEELGVDLDEHIAVVLDAMRGIADQLGLPGPC